MPCFFITKFEHGLYTQLNPLFWALLEVDLSSASPEVGPYVGEEHDLRLYPTNFLKRILLSNVEGQSCRYDVIPC
jgi:hypothetical protein